MKFPWVSRKSAKGKEPLSKETKKGMEVERASEGKFQALRRASTMSRGKKALELPKKRQEGRPA